MRGGPRDIIIRLIQFMAQNKTSLILNNLVEMFLPINSTTITANRHISYSLEPNEIHFSIKLPCPFLLQKVHIEVANDYPGAFSEHFCVKMIKRGIGPDPTQDTPLIDFKRDNIDWRFKARMRSNSNEFVESLVSGGTVRSSKSQNQTETDSDATSFWSNQDDNELKMASDTIKLVSGVGNRFTIVVDTAQQPPKDDPVFAQIQTALAPKQQESEQIMALFLKMVHGIKLFVWPCFRMPTGGAAIPLINTSFLFTSKHRHQETMEADFLVGLSLINGRKFIQATEKFRRVENILLQKGSREDIHRAVLIELIIGEAMNQHSQISEKINAFQRAVDLSTILMNSEGAPEKNFNALEYQQSKITLKQDQAYKYLMRLHPQLVRILINNMDSQIEAVRLACLKTIEYLLDTLGCSLDSSLINILVAVINNYPIHFRATGQQPYCDQDRRVKSFFEAPTKFGSQNTYQTDQLAPGKFSNQFFSLAELHNPDHCVLKDILAFNQSYIQTSKNYHHHILEGLLLLLSSMSQNLLIQIFNEIVLKMVFTENLAQDLVVYILKFAEKIVSLCQGDLVLPVPFTTNLVNAIMNQSQPAQQNNQQSEDAVFQQACVNLWHSCKINLFPNYSRKGQKLLLEWLLQSLTQIIEQVNPQQNDQKRTYSTRQLTSKESQRLLLILDIIEMLADGENQNMFRNVFNQGKQLTLQRLCHREAQNNSSENNSDQAESQRRNDDSIRTFGRFDQPMLKQSRKCQTLTLELCALINPLLFWFNYSIENQDRLPLFEIVWRTLIKTFDLLPHKRINFDCVSIMLPVLERVNDFCRSSSPSLEMLSFLKIVLLSISNNLIHTIKPVVKKKLLVFLDQFLLSFSKSIPHNLHDEVFQVCELLLDLLGNFNALSQEHIKVVIEALIHKYTMRSKAHNTLTEHFIKMWVLDNSAVKLDEQSYLEEPLNHASPHAYHQQVPPQVPGLQAQLQASDVANQVNNGGNELAENQQEGQQVDSEPNQFEENQLDEEDQASLNSLQQRLDPQPNGQSQFAPQFHQQPQLALFFDIFCEVCLVNNKISEPESDNQEDEQEHLYFERLTLLADMIQKMEQEHLSLYRRLLSYPNFKDSVYNIFKNERSQKKATSLMESLTKFYMKHSVPKNLYEHPIVNQRRNNLRQNNRVTQSQINVQGRPVHSEPSVDLFQFNQEDEIPIENEQMFEGDVAIDFESPANGEQVPRPMNMHYSQHQVPPQQLHLESERVHYQSQQNVVLADEISLINRERLILIQVHACLARHASIYPEKEDQSINTDANSQLSALNLLENLFINLLPTPTFQNKVIKSLLQKGNEIPPAQHPHRFHHFRNHQGYSSGGSNVSQVQNNHTEVIPDLETMTIPEQSVLGDLQPTAVNGFASEFECWDLRYQHARLAFAFKMWSFLEQILTKSCWSTIRALVMSVICFVVKIPDISKIRGSQTHKLKQLLFPLLNKLLKSKESELKAGGLNILGSFCGVTNITETQRIEQKVGAASFNSAQFENNQLIHGNELNIDSNRDTIKLVEHLQEFRKNSQFVSLAIWQEVFELQEDWDHTVQDAATVLIQLCAPKDSVTHFNKIKKERYNLQLDSLLNSFSPDTFCLPQDPARANRGDLTTEAASNEVNDLSQPKINTVPTLFSRSQMQAVATGDQIQEGSGSDGYYEEEGSEEGNSYFYMENFSEEQLLEILKVFKLKKMSVKSLWMEKTVQSMQQNSPTLLVTATSSSQFLLDQFEDSMLGMQTQKQNQDELDSDSQGDEDNIYLYQGGNKTGESHQKKISMNTVDSSSDQTEDLGIIDLDKQEGGSDFDELDDDKLPVLKNTYSRKNRPNNSKSVAIGSRSQGGNIKQREASTKNDSLIEICHVQVVQEQKSDDEEDIGIYVDEGESDSGEEAILEQQRQKMARSEKDEDSESNISVTISTNSVPVDVRKRLHTAKTNRSERLRIPEIQSFDTNSMNDLNDIQIEINKKKKKKRAQHGVRPSSYKIPTLRIPDKFADSSPSHISSANTVKKMSQPPKQIVGESGVLPSSNTFLQQQSNRTEIRRKSSTQQQQLNKNMTQSRYSIPHQRITAAPTSVVKTRSQVQIKLASRGSVLKQQTVGGQQVAAPKQAKNLHIKEGAQQQQLQQPHVQNSHKQKSIKPSMVAQSVPNQVNLFKKKTFESDCEEVKTNLFVRKSKRHAKDIGYNSKAAYLSDDEIKNSQRIKESQTRTTADLLDKQFPESDSARLAEEQPDGTYVEDI